MTALDFIKASGCGAARVLLRVSMRFEGSGEEKGRGGRGKAGRTLLPFGAGLMGRDGRGVRFVGCGMFAGGCGEGGRGSGGVDGDTGGHNLSCLVVSSW